MDQALISSEDYPILIQWVAIIIPLLFVGVRSLLEDGVIEGKTFFIILLLCNAAIILSVYEDVIFFYDLVVGESGDKYNNKSLLFFINFSPVVGIGRLLAIGSLLMYYLNMDDSKPINKWLAQILFGINLIIGIPSLILALL